MRKDTQLLQDALKELERVELMFPGLTNGGMIGKIEGHLKEVLQPEIKDDLFVKPGDECQCGALAVDVRITHWGVNKLCEACAAAYDLATGNGRKWAEGARLAEKGSDPYSVV